MKTIFRWVMAVFFIAAGVNHFVLPRTYMEIMPPYLPWHPGLIYISGLAEIVLGAAAVVPALRRFAGWGLIALLIAVFPANVHMALNGFHSVPSWALWARLPLQLLLIAWVYWTCLSKRIRHD